MNDSGKKPQWTWENLGLANLVEEHKQSPDFKPENPPQELVERTIESCLVEGEKRRQQQHRERMENSFWYRTYHNAADYLKGLWK